MKNNKGFVPVLILIIVLLGGIGYFAYQNMQLKKSATQYQSTPTPYTTLVSSPSPTADPTANWRVITNKTYGFSIKVPGYISQLKTGPGSATIINDADWVFTKTDVSLLDATHKSISDAAITLEIASNKNAAQENFDLHCKGSQLSFDQEIPTISHTSTINGAEQYIQAYGPASHSTAPQVKYWDSKVCFMKNGVEYEIYYQNYENSNTDPVFDQILSTFKFSSEVQQTEDILGIIKTLSAPMKWSEEKQGVINANSCDANKHQASYIESTFNDKPQNKIPGILCTDRCYDGLEKYGWKYLTDAIGVGEDYKCFTKQESNGSTRILDVDLIGGYGGGQYKIFLSEEFKK